MENVRRKRIKLRDRFLPDYTSGEEIFNMVTHIVGGAVGIATLVLCVVFAAIRGSVAGVLTSVLFGVSMIALYSVSSVYHGLRTDMSKKVMQVIDHCTIYFLIGGTYTPVLVCSVSKIDKVACWVTFGVVWGLAALATTLTAIDLKKYNVFSMLCYIGMGWSILFSIRQAYMALGKTGFGLLLGGGISYTVGAIIYGLGKKVRYFHSIFHIFVVMGSVLQALSVLLYVILPL